MSTSTAFGPGRFGLPASGPATPADTEINSISTASLEDAAGALNPRNPLVAFGAIAAVVFGLIAFSTSVRVGKTSASVTIGETK